jgi:hypothetical protein
MLLILEIVLAVKAFKNGWRWRVLWPFGIGFTTAFLMGVAAVAGGGSTDAVAPLALLVEVGIIVALSMMAWRAPGARSAPASAVTVPPPAPAPDEPRPLDGRAA